MKGNEVLALICKAQNAEHFAVFSQGFWGIIYLTAGWYNIQPSIALLWSGDLKKCNVPDSKCNRNMPF